MSGACKQKRHQNPINGLNFMREMVKTEKRKNVVLSVEHGHAFAGHGPCVHSALFGTAVRVHGTGRACCQDFGFRVFCAFLPISVLNWPLV